MFKQRRVEYVNSVEVINEVLEDAKNGGKIGFVNWDDLPRNTSLSNVSLIEDKLVNIEVTTRKSRIHLGKACTYVFSKDGSSRANVNALDCFKLFQRKYKIPEVQAELGIKKDVTGKYEYSAGPLIGYAEEEGEDYLYVYDLNSAYASILRDKIPDLHSYRIMDTVQEGEIGFIMDYKLPLVHSGNHADIVFKLIDSPYRDMVNDIYKRMHELKKGDPERDKLKALINLNVGMYQRHNPFMRAYIVNMCNKFIEDRLDENSVMWNTDAIYSKVPRPDLEIGDGIGQFKVEYEGLIRHRGLNYQYVDSETHYRGVPKAWFNKEFNLLTDAIPQNGNVYRFNKEKLIIEEVPYV